MWQACDETVTERNHFMAHLGFSWVMVLGYGAVSDHHLAEDAAQEAFAVACRDLGRLRRVDRFAQWLGAICRKVARRAAKSRFRQPFCRRSRSQQPGPTATMRGSPSCGNRCGDWASPAM